MAFRCLRVGLRTLGECLEAANYTPDDAAKFMALIDEAPDDCFMAADGRIFLLADVIRVGDEIVRPAPSPPGMPRLTYRRLKVQLTSSATPIEAANVPDTPAGIGHFASLRGRRWDHDFLTVEGGYLPLRETAERQTKPRIKHDEILRPEDLENE